ncbi:hypothetical protein EDC05_002735 [Coemansia umbellata]|uniref:SEA domain-containing protein n=1 Tax=Coemansia umbellata TaxID=1424467 RepID=A0ABQ8PNG0_9FUNG|nr:hypothetical protein EDC05_002735 [Coemansia umbellata]
MNLRRTRIALALFLFVGAVANANPVPQVNGGLDATEDIEPRSSEANQGSSILSTGASSVTQPSVTRNANNVSSNDEPSPASRATGPSSTANVASSTFEEDLPTGSASSNAAPAIIGSSATDNGNTSDNNTGSTFVHASLPGANMGAVGDSTNDASSNAKTFTDPDTFTLTQDDTATSETSNIPSEGNISSYHSTTSVFATSPDYDSSTFLTEPTIVFSSNAPSLDHAQTITTTTISTIDDTTAPIIDTTDGATSTIPPPTFTTDEPTIIDETTSTAPFPASTTDGTTIIDDATSTDITIPSTTFVDGTTAASPTFVEDIETSTHKQNYTPPPIAIDTTTYSTPFTDSTNESEAISSIFTPGTFTTPTTISISTTVSTNRLPPIISPISTLPRFNQEPTTSTYIQGTTSTPAAKLSDSFEISESTMLPTISEIASTESYTSASTTHKVPSDEQRTSVVAGSTTTAPPFEGSEPTSVQSTTAIPPTSEPISSYEGGKQSLSSDIETITQHTLPPLPSLSQNTNHLTNTFATITTLSTTSTTPFTYTPISTQPIGTKSETDKNTFTGSFMTTQEEQSTAQSSNDASDSPSFELSEVRTTNTRDSSQSKPILSSSGFFSLPTGSSILPEESATETATGITTNQESGADSTLEHTKPEFTWPEISWPEVSWPEVTWPEISWPSATHPEFSWPEITWPSATRPEFSWPEITWPSATHPEFSWPEITWPDITWPERSTPTSNFDSDGGSIAPSAASSNFWTIIETPTEPLSFNSLGDDTALTSQHTHKTDFDSTWFVLPTASSNPWQETSADEDGTTDVLSTGRSSTSYLPEPSSEVPGTTGTLSDTYTTPLAPTTEVTSEYPEPTSATSKHPETTSATSEYSESTQVSSKEPPTATETSKTFIHTTSTSANTSTGTEADTETETNSASESKHTVQTSTSQAEASTPTTAISISVAPTTTPMPTTPSTTTSTSKAVIDVPTSVDFSRLTAEPSTTASASDSSASSVTLPQVIYNPLSPSCSQCLKVTLRILAPYENLFGSNNYLASQAFNAIPDLVAQALEINTNRVTASMIFATQDAVATINSRRSLMKRGSEPSEPHYYISVSITKDSMAMNPKSELQLLATTLSTQVRDATSALHTINVWGELIDKSYMQVTSNLDNLNGVAEVAPNSPGQVISPFKGDSKSNSRSKWIGIGVGVSCAVVIGACIILVHYRRRRAMLKRQVRQNFVTIS